MALDKPIFFTSDPNQIVQELITFYETETGKTLQPAQVERLLINAFGYREALFRVAAQEAALQNLVSFASRPVLDYLGELVGVTRLPESAAQTTIEFTVTNVNPAVIPGGTRVASNDGLVVFETIDSTAVPGNSGIVQITCQAQTPGVIGNGYIAANVSLIRDPLPFVTAATNIDTSTGGSDEEDDDSLRERIKLAPEAFSVAGSYGAYKFHAQSADPTIVDVAIVSPIPGTVAIYPLVEGGITTPGSVLTAVENKCSDEKVRPLTDTVEVYSPTVVGFLCDVALTLYDWADQTSVEAKVTDNLTAFFNKRAQSLGADVTVQQIIAQCMVEGVYSVAVSDPNADVVVTSTEVAVVTSITVSTAGLTNG